VRWLAGSPVVRAVRRLWEGLLSFGCMCACCGNTAHTATLLFVCFSSGVGPVFRSFAFCGSCVFLLCSCLEVDMALNNNSRHNLVTMVLRSWWSCGEQLVCSRPWAISLGYAARTNEGSSERVDWKGLWIETCA